MKYGFVGEKTESRFLPEIFGKLADHEYEILEPEKGAFADVLKNSDFSGLNVGEEFAGEIGKYLSDTDEHAAELGFVDTVTRRGGRLYDRAPCSGQRPQRGLPHGQDRNQAR